MGTFEQYMEQATAGGADRQLPGCVAIAATKNGIAYSRSFGMQSVDPASPLSDKPMTPDTTMWIASCTKLVTAIAAMQCVEKGLLNLDDDVSSILTEFKNPDILVGFEDDTGQPIYKKTTGFITLRMLLTHQSGLGYSFIQPELAQYSKYAKLDPEFGKKLLAESYLFPLLYEPGTSWSYGVGLDWAGLMVERVTGKTLGAYMEENILKPIGMNSTSFRIKERADILSRRADMALRTAEGVVVPNPTRFFSDDAPDDHGGGGLFSCPQDYVNLLVSVLKNDGTLLTPPAMDVLFTPCLSPDAIVELRKNRATMYKTFRESKPGSAAVVKVIQPDEMNYAPGGQISERGWLGGRKAGSMSWGGLPNLIWVLDRESDIALLFCTQLLPPGDAAVKAAFERFEYAVYNGELGNIGVKD
ncbi:hypothetical protein PISL3812_01129 [Talaromyces islandicus]|uniref:Beta-lactamase-related domain-containing protein n=1 Tax=Talaromyces islandicus TaxID=28573 RepID=A0A0U1LLA5_TALIS|nr:hypothetical protein PISL3812_01129 [Talaromyces islandicus]